MEPLIGYCKSLSAGTIPFSRRAGGDGYEGTLTHSGKGFYLSAHSFSSSYINVMSV